jgi:hypothetical protein
MKFLISLPMVLWVACAGDSTSPSETSSTQARTGTRGSSERAASRDQGGIDRVESAQRSTAGSKVSSADAGSATPARSGEAQAGHSGKAASTPKASAAARSEMRAAQRRRDEAMSSDAGIEADMNKSATDTDAGAASSAPHHDGSCCVTSTLPGCGDSALQACVCALAPECCTTGWSESCTFIVSQKYCQPGVRECVCGSA